MGELWRVTAARFVNYLANQPLNLQSAGRHCLTFVLSGAPSRMQTKHALLIGASGLEHGVRLRTHH
jgi:hypothetical protein